MFKVGDKVRCIKTDDYFESQYGLYKNKIYTIKKYMNGVEVCLVEIEKYGSWNPNRFELVKEEIPKKDNKQTTENIWGDW